jgi:hypothetical protein
MITIVHFYDYFLVFYNQDDWYSRGYIHDGLYAEVSRRGYSQEVMYACEDRNRVHVVSGAMPLSGLYDKMSL